MSPCFEDTAKNTESFIKLIVGNVAFILLSIALTCKKTYMYCSLMTDLTCSHTSILLHHLHSTFAN